MALTRLGGPVSEFSPTSGARRMDMKNTGKRIFFSATVFALVNAAFVVAAGSFASQR